MESQEPQILTPFEEDTPGEEANFITFPENAAYCPLALCGKGWSLMIQSRPEAKLTRTGKKPSFEEVADCLKMIHAPIWSIEVFQVLIELAECADN